MLKTLALVKKADMAKIDKIEQNSKETRPDGMYELFCDLMNLGRTESYNAGRIYFLAYLLYEEGIKFNIGFKNS